MLFRSVSQSRYGVRAEKSRLLVAKYLLSKVDSVLHSNKSASVVVIGDFNDVATSDAMQLFSQKLYDVALLCLLSFVQPPRV